MESYRTIQMTGIFKWHLFLNLWVIHIGCRYIYIHTVWNSKSNIWKIEFNREEELKKTGEALLVIGTNNSGFILSCNGPTAKKSTSVASRELAFLSMKRNGKCPISHRAWGALPFTVKNGKPIKYGAPECTISIPHFIAWSSGYLFIIISSFS